jgi:cell division protein FtsB
MKDKVIEQIVSFVLLGLFTFIGNLGINYILRDRGVVRIGNVISIQDGKYETAVDIYNFQESSLENIKIKILDNIDIDSIRTSEALNITKEPANVSNDISSTFKISSIGEKKKVTLFFTVKKIITYNDIEIMKNGNKLRVEYTNDVKSPIENQVMTLLISALTYTIMLGVFDYYTKKRFKREKEDLEKQNDQIKRLVNVQTSNIDSLKYDQDKLREDIKSTTQRYKKRELVLLSKLSDYSKELNFWRDSIRSILYKSKIEPISPDAIFDTVTNTLKTYQVKTNNEPDFESLKILSNLLRNETNSSSKEI